MTPDISKQATRWRIAFILLFGLLMVIGAATIGDYGMGWDEPTRWRSGDAKIDYYTELLRAEDRLEVIRKTPSDRYPGLFDVSVSTLHRLTGLDRFMLGHWQAFLFGLAGLAALWKIGAIFGGPRLGFGAVLLLVITPPFYGHWFHNPKDIPFAATYTIGLWTLIELFRRGPAVSKRWLIGVTIAIGLCMATRIAGIVLLAYFVAGVGAVLASQLWSGRPRCDWKASWGVLKPWLWSLPMVGLGAYLVLLPWWPGAHKNLFAVSGETFQRLHVSASEIPLFFRGEFMQSADAPHLYALWMFMIKAPEILLMGLVFALFAVGVMIKRVVALGEEGAPIIQPKWVILFLGGFFPLLYLTVTAPALHNGARHFLFIFPAMCVWGAWGLFTATDWIATRHARFRRFVQIILGFLVFLPVFHLVQLHPYQYVYYNALVGGPSGAYGYYEGEYWFTSSKHALEQLDDWLQSAEVSVSSDEPFRVFILGPWQVAEPFVSSGLRLTGNSQEADFWILNTQMLVHTHFQNPELFVIERMGKPIVYVQVGPRSLLGSELQLPKDSVGLKQP